MKPGSPVRIKRWLQCVALIFGCFQAHLMVVPATNQNIDHPCTALILRLPNYPVSGRLPIRLFLDVAGAKKILGDENARNLVYNWETSQGTIISGQGTPNALLQVNGSQRQGDIVVTIKVKGIPPECQIGVTHTLKVDTECNTPSQYDEYGELSSKDEEARLDSLAGSLQNSSRSIVYLLAYAGRNSCIWEAEWRANRARKYLIEHHRLPGDRIIVVDGGYRETSSIQVYFSDNNKCGPIPTPTLSADDAHVSGSCAEKYKDRQPPSCKLKAIAAKRVDTF